ncbi:DUF4124 domain-containing protein [Legionella clemsonensis]|uniref:DUF4124 domain-containing protein n=1 Tax=Legionella clemsonensis TaxID=1867846 RepID=UPI0012FE3ECA|nr:DUF4124 domain-containing protein [Legionella clemsonensis]
MNPLFAEIYQWVDSQGVTHFSDTSHESAKKIELPLISSFSSPSTVKPQKNTQQLQSSTLYEITIVQPKNEATIRNNLGELTVVVKINRQLEAKETLILFCDGKIIRKTHKKWTFQLKGVERGTHELLVKILDEKGKELTTSKSIVFFMHRAYRKKI